MKGYFVYDVCWIKNSALELVFVQLLHDPLIPISHVGEPVVGPGAPTGLIGGQPVSVVGDTCICVSSPDSIVMGATTVLITGKPAVRLSDPTVHGGSIAMGIPTVLIGD